MPPVFLSSSLNGASENLLRASCSRSSTVFDVAQSDFKRELDKTGTVLFILRLANDRIIFRSMFEDHRFNIKELKDGTGLISTKEWLNSYGSIYFTGLL